MNILLRIAGFLLGYLISAVSSFLFFVIARHDPHRPAPTGFILFAALVGVAFAFLGGWLAARIGGRTTGTTVGVAIAVVAVWLAWYDHAGTHWSQWVAVLLMAPAAIVGANVAARRLRN